ncbi:DUF262 domain-containing protein [Dolichospermum circinale]|uniref:DUF262 domain-containing protein n=1 Tax=Dolichospermum circinale TaxID=109265 RepID=UPI00232E5E54|nr:DUF262 domain-containing protein [Dolichospermum circinale]MDB9455159.1 DUF262 domain-containing protein [Dolichospermum circinale CS-541/06]MDB9461544.1 DUF262 domain-containing protein [Dolichospermum circinale CS-541/04]MDB9546657.1 DUF262 domain-containing protein [Dolichospermum circinale CS-1031]
MNYDIQETESPRLEVEYYGADFPVDTLVKRMAEKEFIIPGFQRKYVWKEEEASRFIETLLLGLPSPSLFLAKDKFSKKYLVIDGQQRLKTLQYFFQGFFEDGTVFKLKNVVQHLEGLTYSTLPPSERRELDNAIIHCIIISESYDPQGIFYLFERLNTTGTPLNPQEIRNAIYHGYFSELLQDLSRNETWRELYGKDDIRANEQEHILRFLALHFDLENYSGNMKNFLNQFMLKNKDLDIISENEIKNIFIKTIDFLKNCIGSKVFYEKKKFQILFDSVMLLTAQELEKGLECSKFKKFYELLINDKHFWSFSQPSTTNRKNLMTRLEYVKELYRDAHL